MYNKEFKLDIRDIEIIEQALEAKVARRAASLLTNSDQKKQLELRELRELLGRISYQKNWYRPKKGYISG